MGRVSENWPETHLLLLNLNHFSFQEVYLNAKHVLIFFPHVGVTKIV